MEEVGERGRTRTDDLELVARRPPTQRDRDVEEHAVERAGEVEIVVGEPHEVEHDRVERVAEQVTKEGDGMREDLDENRATLLLGPSAASGGARPVDDSYEVAELATALEQTAEAPLERELVDGVEREPMCPREGEQLLRLGERRRKRLLDEDV